MIHYNPGYWSICFAFSLRGSVFPKAFVWSAGSSVFAVVLRKMMDANDDISLMLTPGSLSGSTSSLLTGFTFILGFLVVFRSQTAYSRWWEGGTLMQQLRGEWFNAASSLVAFCNRDESRRDEVLKFQHQLVRLISLLYASALQQICTMEDRCFYLIDINGFDKKSLEFLQSDDCHDHCEVVLQWIQRLVVLADSDKVIDVAPPILSRVYNQLGNGIVNLANARKITEFPIPFPLAQMITVMLLIHWFVIPLTCAVAVDSAFWAGFLTFVVVFSFWTINYIATELEMPFGDDPNDLPLHEMQSDLNASLTSLLQERTMVCPDFSFDAYTHGRCEQVRVNPAALEDRDAVVVPIASHHRHSLLRHAHRLPIRKRRNKAWKHEDNSSIWATFDCWPCRKSPKEVKLESAPMLKEEMHEASRPDDYAYTIGNEQEWKQEDDLQGHCVREQEHGIHLQQSSHSQVASIEASASGDGAYLAGEREDEGISPSQVVVPQDVLGGIVANHLASADTSNGGVDPILQSSGYHLHYHHHHRIEMEQSQSNTLPTSRSQRGAQNALADSCCLQFVNSTSNSHRGLQSGLASTAPSPHIGLQSGPASPPRPMASSAYRALQQTVV